MTHIELLGTLPRPPRRRIRRLAGTQLAAAACMLSAAGAAIAAPATYTPVPGSPFAAGWGPNAIAYNSAGTLLAVADIGTDPAAGGPNTVSLYTIGPDGSPSASPVTKIKLPGRPEAVAFSPTGNLLAVADGGGTINRCQAPNVCGVSVFSVSGGGQATQVGGSPFSAGAGAAPVALAFNPNATLLATANQEDPSTGTHGNSTTVFSVAGSGSLSMVGGSPYAAGAGPDSVAFSPDGSLLALANGGDSSISMYAVDLTTGALAPAGTTATGQDPVDITFDPASDIVATADYKGGTVSEFQYGAAGSLTPYSTTATGYGTRAIAYSGIEPLLIVANSVAGTVTPFVDAGGILTATPGVSVGPDPVAVAFNQGTTNYWQVAVASWLGDSLSVLTPSAPTATITSPQPGSTFTRGQVVPTSFSCSDSMFAPGLTECLDSAGTDGLPGTATGQLDTSTLGQHTYLVATTSFDGYTANASVDYLVADPPSVTITGPANGASYAQGQVVDAAYSCADGAAGTGIATCTGTVRSGAAIDTSTAGTHTFSVTATSNDGLQKVMTVTYSVTAAAPGATPASGSGGSGGSTSGGGATTGGTHTGGSHSSHHHSSHHHSGHHHAGHTRRHHRRHRRG